jgi:hypothetical protein
MRPCGRLYKTTRTCVEQPNQNSLLESDLHFTPINSPLHRPFAAEPKVISTAALKFKSSVRIYKMSQFKNVASRTTVKTKKAVKVRLVDNKAPVEAILSGPVNLNELSVDERLGLLRGPKVSIVMEGRVISHGVVPLRAFMATSEKANSYFRKTPQHKQFELPTGCATEKALKHVLKATTTTDAIGDAEVLRVPGGVSFHDNIQLYKAGVALGMSDLLNHITGYLRGSISRELISYENLTATVTSLSAQDPLFQHLANDLARRRFQNAISDEAEFALYLEQHQNLKQAMADIDAQHESDRQRAKRAHTMAKKKQEEHERYEQKKKEDREWYEQEKQANNQYRARVRALTKKLNEAKGGVVSLTREEGELRRELEI